ncbi:MAG: aldo/keto reductase [Planctomycetaceae bacterium]|nr:aldo/keto reductase [Planctomycetaceae bacterium]
MSNLTRRQFLASTSLAAVGTALGGRFATAAPPSAPAPVKIKTGVDTMTLGKSGIKTTVLGIGTGTRSGREQADMGTDAFVRLIREGYDRGIRYIDTADSYGYKNPAQGPKAHEMVKAALRELPKGEVFVQTKLSSRTAEQAAEDLDRIRRELGLETLDTLLIHCMTKDGWNVDKRPVIDFYLKAKEKGQIRSLGVSCHGYEALRVAADTPEMDVHLVRINPYEKIMDAAPALVAEQIAKMHADNRGVIGMKIYGEGLLQTREERLESIKYVLGLGTIQAFTIGFSKIEHVDETLELIREAAAA